MTRLLNQLEEISRELIEDIENLKRLAETIPQLLESKQKQLDQVAAVSRTMATDDTDVLSLITRYAEPRRARGGRRRGRTLPTDIMSIIHAAGGRGATLDQLYDGLAKSRTITRQNLSSTLSRMKSQGKISKRDGYFQAEGRQFEE